MDIPQKKLEAFQALSRTGHFGKAAQSLGMSQPTLSRHIQDLETRLGFQLFERHTRVVSLTPMGQEVMNYAKQLSAFQSRAEQRIEARRQGKSGHVVIASLPSLIGQVVAPFLKEVQETHPGLAIDILDQPSPRIRETVLLEQADIGLDSPVDDQFDDLIARHLLTDALCVVVGDTHPLAERGQVDIPELVSIDLIGSAPGTSLRHLTNQSFARHDLVFRPRYELNQVVSVLGLVEFGLGAAILPVSAGFALPHACKRVKLLGAAERRTWIFRKEHTPLDPAVAHVMAALTKHSAV